MSLFHSRRQFLRGMGGFALALPFLPSLVSKEVLAAVNGNPPKRFVAICTYDGYYEHVYYPSVDANVQFAPDVFHRQLSDIPGALSETFGNEFDALRSKMNIYRGLDIAGSVGHSSANMLCGARRAVFGDDAPVDPVGNSRSIDVVLGLSKNFYPQAPKFLALRGQEPSYDYGMSFDKDTGGATKRIPYLKTAKSMFDQVFGNLNLDQGALDQLQQKKKTIGDMVLQDYNRLRTHRRISADDKVVLDNFVAEVQTLNQKINSLPSVLACSKPSQAALSSQYWDLLSETEKASFFSNYIDTMVAAMACDMTRVCIISIRLFGHDHALSHGNPFDRANQLQYIANTNKIVKIVKEFATKMNSVTESNGKTMLDNSILFWGSEDAEGPAHRCESMPAVSFGSAAGNMKTGYYMDYRQRPFFRIANQGSYAPVGRSYTQLLITFMRALGLEASEYLPYGDGGGFGSYDNNVRYSEGRYIAYEKFRNDPLPFISLV